ncbi:uncharacterized protein [Physcomitrium patens]|uniref:uncharacterized protein n=1 Tax=Physcomitrium patens TaxID=3218 RepID=UPI003CCD5069
MAPAVLPSCPLEAASPFPRCCQNWVTGARLRLLASGCWFIENSVVVGREGAQGFAPDGNEWLCRKLVCSGVSLARVDEVIPESAARFAHLHLPAQELLDCERARITFRAEHMRC